MMPVTQMHHHWPFARVVAHRGAGLMAPENTLAALRTGHTAGYRAVEFDIMLTADAVPVLMHDPGFGRTVRVPGHSQMDKTPWAVLAQQDAGAWFSPAFAGEPVPRLDAVLAYCHAQGIWMNAEIKPAPGHAHHTGQIAAQTVRDWLGTIPASTVAPVLFSSFAPEALAAARQYAPEVPRALLFDRIPDDWLARLQALGCIALHCNHLHLKPSQAGAIGAAGYGLFCYTVNQPERALELLGWGVDAFCTDRIDLFRPDFASAPG